VGEVAEPHVPGRGGSSTLPHKRNPIASAYVLAAQRGVQALVPLMQGAMLDQHERGAGPWQAELLALPQAFVLTHGALLHARLLAEGMVVDPARMRRNLDITQGAVVAEAVMMGLAPVLGREQAHEVVKHATDRALKQGGGLTQALLADDSVTAHLEEPPIRRLTDPAGYLGATQSFIDRVLARANAI
jgi:3-carboxy-cis,cis-muconate cycloisomerase